MFIYYAQQFTLFIYLCNDFYCFYKYKIFEDTRPLTHLCNKKLVLVA